MSENFGMVYPNAEKEDKPIDYTPYSFRQFIFEFIPNNDKSGTNSSNNPAAHA